MSDLFFSTMERLTPILLKGDIAACEREVAGEMHKLAVTPFHIVLDLSISNDPEEAARHFDRFFERESNRFPIGAAYTEMNGFDINPNRWYCDLFAHKADGGCEEYGWISDWQSKPFESYHIKGLEPLQKVYASDAFRDKKNRTASYMSSLMVVVKFQRLMQQASAHMKLLRFPLYVTAHDFDFIACFDPRPESARTPIHKPSAEEVARELIENLSSTDPDQRFRAVNKLPSIGPAAKPALGVLISLLDDEHLPTRQSAAASLGRIDPDSDIVVSALVAKLTDDQAPYVKQEIIRTLGRCSATEKSVDALSKAILNDDEDLRYVAAISLKLLGSKAKAALPVLEKLMATERADRVRVQAEVALKRMRGD